MSAINREDAIEALLSRLAEREEPCPPWIYATIRECLDDLPSLPSTEPLVHDGFYLCDKKPGACPSWERKGWTKCESKHCNRTSLAEHALKLPDDGWIPVEKGLPDKYGWYLCTLKDGRVNCYYWNNKGEWLDNGKKHLFDLYHVYSKITGMEVLAKNEESVYWTDWVIAWQPLPKPYQPKEKTQ